MFVVILTKQACDTEFVIFFPGILASKQHREAFPGGRDPGIVLSTFPHLVQPEQDGRSEKRRQL